MKRILMLLALITLFAHTANGQGTQIRNLPSALSVSSGDMFPGDAFAGGTYKYTFSQLFGARTITCTPPLLCDGGSSMTLGADRTLSIRGPNARTINIVCTGNSTIDTAAKDAAVTTLCASDVGGIIHFSNTCALSSAIVCDAANGVTSPIIIEGDGRRQSILSFSACAGGSGSDCILLASESAMGAGGTDGWGVRDLIIGGPSTKTLIHLKGLQGALVKNIYTSSGDTSLSIEENRYDLISDSYFLSPTTTGIKIIAENYLASWFKHIEITSGGSAGSGINWTKAGTNDVGGAYFDDVVVNGTWTGSGFLFSSASQNSMFIFCSTCVADGNFTADSFRFVKATNVFSYNSFAVNQAAASNASGITLDSVSEAVFTGGAAYANTGASGSDISLKNTVNKTLISGIRLTGPTTGVKVDSSTHDVDMRPAEILGATTISDPTKIVPSSSRQYPVNTASTASQWFTAYNSLTGAFTKAQPAFTDISGTATAAQTPLAVILAGTSGGQTVKGDTASGGNLILMSTNHATKGKILFGTSGYDEANNRLGINWTSPDSPLAISGNATALPAIFTGTQFHLASVDGTGTVILSDVFGGANTYAARRANNTNASPSALTTNDIIMNIAAYGYGASAYGAIPGAAIRLIADQTWTNSAQGSRIDLMTDDTGTTTLSTKLSISAMGHITHTQTTAPTVACTGTGTSPSAPTIDSGGTDHQFTVVVNTGTGSPGSTGTCTVTFATAFSAARPIVCMLVKGATAWGNGSTIMETTESASAPVFTWANIVSGTPTGLTVSTSYKFSCIGDF